MNYFDVNTGIACIAIVREPWTQVGKLAALLEAEAEATTDMVRLLGKGLRAIAIVLNAVQQEDGYDRKTVQYDGCWHPSWNKRR